MANIFGNPELEHELKATQLTLETDNALKIRTDNANALFVEKTNGQDVLIVDTSGVTGSVTIQGDLNVLGASTTIISNNTSIVDPNILLGSGNTSNLVDLGWHGTYNDGTQKYCGLFRDASDSGNFKLYNGLTVNPVTNIIDTADASFSLASLQLHTLDVSNSFSVKNTATNSEIRLYKNDNINYFAWYIDNASGSSLSLWSTAAGGLVGKFDTSKVFHTYGGININSGTTLDKYKVATHSATIPASTNAVSSDTALTLKYTIVGNTVTLDIPTVSATADATGGQAMAITSIPSEIRPTTAKFFTATKSNNNGTSAIMGCYIDNAGTITFYQDGTVLGSTWASTGSIGWEGFSVSYTLA